MNINNFGPFDPAVWGTISDWVVILIYIVTGCIVYKTLKSQLVLQQLQQKQIDVLLFNHKKESKPEFELSISDSDKSLLHMVYEMGYGFDEDYLLNFNFKLKYNQAKNISLIIEDEAGIELDPYMNDVIDWMDIGQSFRISYNYNMFSDIKEPEIKNLLLKAMKIKGPFCDRTFQINFQDYSGINYKQFITFRFDENIIRFLSETPIELTNG
jgi:hypothetical protein